MKKLDFAMVAELTVKFASVEGFSEKAYSWIDSGASEIEPSWREKMHEVVEGEVEFDSHNPEAPVGPPDGVLARMTTTIGNGNHISSTEYQSESARKKIRAHGADLANVFFEIHKLNDLGFISDGFSLSCSRVGGESGWLRVSMNFRESEEAANPERFRRRLALMRRFGGMGEVGFGHVSYLHNPLIPTAYEEALNIDPETSMKYYPALARGYSWITVLPKEVLEMIGGGDAVRERGLFSEVCELANDAFWLQAGETWNGYLHADLLPLQNLFAPILIPGDPVRDPLGGTSSQFPPQLVAFL